MMDYKKIPTSSEVYYVLLAVHLKQLRVFSSATFSEGVPIASNTACVSTEWGFLDSPIPLCGHESTWKVDDQNNQETTKEWFWLCIPEECDVEEGKDE